MSATEATTSDTAGDSRGTRLSIVLRCSILRLIPQVAYITTSRTRARYLSCSKSREGASVYCGVGGYSRTV